MLIHYILLFFTSFITEILSQDVLGCGGFVKSHVPIDFSRVEVKLVTKNGIVKEKINAAPNNGYYFILIYDKGDYTLELDPPAGWSFTPKSIDLIIDGVNDLCSQGKDIDFVFNGFGITGRVQSLGSTAGPSGVEVELSSKTESRKTLTDAGGTFFFTPVYPGSYSLRITQSKWKVYKNAVNVVVTEGNTELPANALIIQGYEVTGEVRNEGEPVKDAVIVLYSNSDSTHVEGCDKTPLKGLGQEKPVCFTRTNNNGIFTFPILPNGNYFIRPYYKEQNIYYQPDMIAFTVENNNLKLRENFQLVGFSITGRVLKSPKGKPIANAQVFLNNQEITKTNVQGLYKLEKLTAGNYQIRASADGYMFTEINLNINPNIGKIEDLIPTYYRVCGNVMSERSHQIVFSTIGSTKVFTSETEPTTGKFCQYLQGGKYQINVFVNSEDSKAGLRFFPSDLTIEVSSDPIDNIVFSQLKATVNGKINCLSRDDCANLQVTFKPQGDTSGVNEIIIDITSDNYSLSNINPGIYEVYLNTNNLCWKDDRHVVNVNNVNVEIPAFQQTGYAIIVISSHDTELKYKTNNVQEKVLKVVKGRSTHCLERSGSYTFQLSSCHSYETDTVTFDTASEKNELFLQAQKHSVTVGIQATTEGSITALVDVNGVQTNYSITSKDKRYELNLLLSPTDSATIVPQSDILYFEPPSLAITGSTDCINRGVEFTGLEGIVFQGKIIPPLSKAIVSVQWDDEEPITTETDHNGAYKFPPLDKTKKYKLSADKESYILVGPDESGNFLARKLAEIVITVADSVDKKPLQGTLLSLSGGDSYRSNLQTNDEGTISFHSLSPGDYFLRPMMKEYVFDPNSKMIKVNEGETVNIFLVGKRVAYSAFGEITSLNGEPEENVLIVANGISNCAGHSEESTSEPNGQFRIRGLRPHCSYDIAIRGHLVEGSLPIERSAPNSILAENVTDDVRNLKLIVFRPASMATVLLRVLAHNFEHYKTITVKVIRDGDVVIHSEPIENGLSKVTDNGILIDVPAIPLDSKQYIVQMESTLPRYDTLTDYFVANSSFVFVELEFTIKSNVVEQDIKQTSVWTLVLLFIILILVYNVDVVTRVLREQFGTLLGDLVNSTFAKNTPREYTVDNTDIDQIVRNINSVKRKPKPKKI